MKMFNTILFTLFISSGILGNPRIKRCKRLVCVVRNDTPNFIPNEVNTEFCTHLIYDHARLVGNILKNVYPNELTVNGKMGLYANFTALKKQKYGLLTILRAATPWEQQLKPFSEMASTKIRREEFITTTINYLRKHKFDGLDIFWSYPGRFTGKTDDVYRAADLIKETFEAFENESKATRRPRLLLSMTVHPWKTEAYDIPILTRYTDMVNIICFKMNGSWSPTMEHHSTMNDFKSTIEEYWYNTYIPLQKLNIGMAFFGMYAHVADKSNPNPGGRIVNIGKNARFTPASCGVLSYPQICNLPYDRNKIYRDEARQVPYYFNDGLWVGYDDRLSLREKAIYAANQGIGVFVSDLNDDDYEGASCLITKYPLLRAVFNGCKL